MRMAGDLGGRAGDLGHRTGYRFLEIVEFERDGDPSRIEEEK
jgi:hypothetical protein